MLTLIMVKYLSLVVVQPATMRATKHETRRIEIRTIDVSFFMVTPLGYLLIEGYFDTKS